MPQWRSLIFNFRNWKSYKIRDSLQNNGYPVVYGLQCSNILLKRPSGLNETHIIWAILYSLYRKNDINLEEFWIIVVIVVIFPRFSWSLHNKFFLNSFYEYRRFVITSYLGVTITPHFFRALKWVFITPLLFFYGKLIFCKRSASRFWSLQYLTSN